MRRMQAFMTFLLLSLADRQLPLLRQRSGVNQQLIKVDFGTRSPISTKQSCFITTSTLPKADPASKPRPSCSIIVLRLQMLSLCPHQLIFASSSIVKFALLSHECSLVTLAESIWLAKILVHPACDFLFTHSCA